MYILIFIIFHLGGSQAEAITSVTAEFTTAANCETAAAKIYTQKTDSYHVMWSCSKK